VSASARERGRAPGWNVLGWVILGRTAIQLVAVGLASPRGLLPEEIAGFAFLPAIQIATFLQAFLYAAAWRTHRRLERQIACQIAADLVFTTGLVAVTGGVDSPFSSFYLLVIFYCSLALGQSGGLSSAALGAILYATVVTASVLGWPLGSAIPRTEALGFRVFLHALAFVSVAFLATHLSHRLHAVQRELEIHEQIIASIRAGLVTTGIDGRIRVFNSAAEEIFVADADAVLGTHVQGLIGGELWNRIRRADWLGDLRPLRQESWLTIASGARSYLGFSISPLLARPSGGEPELAGYIVAFQDLTEIRQREEEVRLKDRMAAIGRMAAGLAHEIRNPLASMRGSVEVLRSHLDLDAADARLMDIVIRESDRLNKVVEDFLRFARPRTREREQVDLATVARETCALLANNAEIRERHAIVLDLQPGVTVLANADQMRQVCWNLALNAIRAMPAGGTLRIETRAEQEASEVRFHDDGIGMSREQQDQIFQPFQSGFPGGTGLGLSIVFQIVDDHGGTVRVDSEIGRGTRVVVALPRARSVAAEASLQEARA